MKALLPPGWPRPRGYVNGISATGRLIVTAGVVGWDEQQKFVADTLAGAIDPGRVFDLELPLDEAAEAYAAMDQRRSIKTMLRP